VIATITYVAVVQTAAPLVASGAMVGWIVRIEVIPLTQGWCLAGPSQGKCT
jgi:hypothetical protein